MSIRIIQGDCRAILPTLPANSVHCVVTSPPYWGLRDYGVAGQLGLEPTFTEFIDKMVEVFREVRRVLRPDGTLWLNLGDSYAAGGHGGGGSFMEMRGEAGSRAWALRENKTGWRSPPRGLKPKDLVGIPWRVAFALQADGWWLRQDIIWSKPNPMPESVTDRCTKAHEYVFLLTKSARYFYDAEAIKEAAETDDIRRPYGSPGANALDPRGHQGRGLPRGKALTSPRNDGNAWNENNGRGFIPTNLGRNKRSVWEIATSPFPEAHFATFPPALVEPCIKAGTSEKGCCGKCGAPWERKTKATFVPQQDVSLEKGIKGAGNQKPMDASNSWDGFPRGTTNRTTLGWSPTCTCQATVIPCTVLDPFGGAGTTGLVADRLQRNAILIELNPAYATMAESRWRADAPLFALAAE